jgi:UDP-glucuronate 4-epimerase
MSPPDFEELQNCRILLTGPTSQVGLPLALRLAEKNEIHAIARFKDPATRAPLEAVGIRCVALDLASDSLDALSEDYDYALNFAVVKSGDWGYDLAANVDGVGRLMSHCRKSKAFLHSSSAAVYAFPDQKPLAETDPLGDNHRVMFPTYSISKIAAEAVVRFAAQEFQLPTTIARFSVPYGDNGGWPWFHLMMMKAGAPIPVSPNAPNFFNLIHEDDYIGHIPGLLKLADVPACTLNWGGSDPVSIEQWCGFLSELTGLEAKLETSDDTLEPLPLDTTRMNKALGRTSVDWRDGIRRMVEARNPELLKTDAP